MGVGASGIIVIGGPKAVPYSRIFTENYKQHRPNDRPRDWYIISSASWFELVTIWANCQRACFWRWARVRCVLTLRARVRDCSKLYKIGSFDGDIGGGASLDWRVRARLGHASRTRLAGGGRATPTPLASKRTRVHARWRRLAHEARINWARACVCCVCFGLCEEDSLLYLPKISFALSLGLDAAEIFSGRTSFS